MVEIGNRLTKEMFDNLYDMLENITLRKHNSHTGRLNFPLGYRGGVFGLVRPRYKYKGYLEDSWFSKKYPLINDELFRIGKLICPFEFNSVQVNKNVICPRHKDTGNKGVSLLVSFGEYVGGEIVIEDIKYDAYLTPIIFDGSINEHYNLDNLKGVKYSLIFFS